MKMLKRFFEWIHQKAEIENIPRNGRIISEGQVYWCGLGENVGFEQSGKGERFRRPVLIFKKFSNDLFWGIPLSTKQKNNKYYLKIFFKDSEQSVLLSQLTILDSKRLYEFMGHVSRFDFSNIQNKVVEIIKFKSEPV